MTLTSGFSVGLSVGAVIPFALAVLPVVPRPGRRRALVAGILLGLDVAVRATLLLTLDGFSGLTLAFMSRPWELAMECVSIVLIVIALVIDRRDEHGRAKRADQRFA